jgi:tetraacyldisaccharide 4'-kinase
MLSSTVPVAVSRDRVDGVALAKSQGASIILMDDGFQNPAVQKDAALIVIDSDRGVGNACVFPAGPLRAPLSAQLDRTDALVVVGEGMAAAAIAKRIASRPGRPVLPAHLKPDGAALAALADKPVLAFAGIGDPARFFRTLRANGIDVVRERAFADHHPFSQADIDALLAEAKRDQLTLVTTEKDLVRLRKKGELPASVREILTLPVTLEFADETTLRRFLDERLFAARQKKFGEK